MRPVLTPKWTKNRSGWLCLLAWFFNLTNGIAIPQRADAQVAEIPVDVELTLAKSAGVKGTWTDQGLTYKEKTPGNGARVALVAPTGPEQELVVNTAGDVVTVNLGSGPEVSERASGWGGLHYFTALEPGTSGNDITVEIVTPEDPGQGGGVAVNGNAIVITLETDGTNYSTTTAGMVGAWLAGSTAAASLVTWDLLGGNTTDLVFPTGMVGHLSGGLSGYQTTTTANDLAALGVLGGLVEVTGSGTAALQGRAETALTGGVAGSLTSTGAQVVAALAENEVITATGGDGTVLAAAGPLTLALAEQALQEGALTVYEWDAQDRLVGVTMPDGKAYHYTYDYRTRRIGIGEGGTISNPKQTAVLFGGGLSLAEYESPTAQTTISNPETSTVHYMRGPDMGGGVGGMLYSVRGSDLRYSLSNGRGDIVAQSDGNAAVTWTASYEAYGKRTKETGNNADKQRANSKDEDPTGLLNEGFRYRDIETGMFISRDPAGFVDGPNVYAYVKQNPWTSWDPLGLRVPTNDREAATVARALDKNVREYQDLQTAYSRTSEMFDRYRRKQGVGRLARMYGLKLQHLGEKLYETGRDLKYHSESLSLYIEHSNDPDRINEFNENEAKTGKYGISLADDPPFDDLFFPLADTAFTVGGATSLVRGGVSVLSRFAIKGAVQSVVPALREAYIREVYGISQVHQQMLRAGFSEEAIARAVHQMRREIGVTYKSLTPPEKLAEITARNLEKYGDPLGPTIEYLRSQGKSWQSIIESAARPGGADLGLKFSIPRDPLPALDP